MFNIINNLTCEFVPYDGFSFTPTPTEAHGFKELKFTERNFNIDRQDDLHLLLSVIRETDPNTPRVIHAGPNHYTKLFIIILAEIFGKNYNLINEILYTNYQYMMYEHRKRITMIPISRVERGELIHSVLKRYTTMQSVNSSKRIFGNAQSLPFEYQVIAYDIGMISRYELNKSLSGLVHHIIQNELLIFATESKYTLTKDTLKSMYDIDVASDDDVPNKVLTHPLLSSIYITTTYNVAEFAEFYKKAIDYFYDNEEIRDHQLVELIDMYVESQFSCFDFHATEFIGDIDFDYKKINMFIITNSKQGKWKSVDFTRP